MKRVVLLHWKAEEAKEPLARLKKAGFEPRLVSDPASGGMRVIREGSPEAFVIDLSRLPSPGKAVAIALRQHKGTRGLPLVFAGGDPEKVTAIRELLPDAMYENWNGVVKALKTWKPPAAPPVVPKYEVSYSGTPLPKKLGIKPDSVVVLIGAPDSFERKLNPLPEGAQVRRTGRDKAMRVMLFATTSRELEIRFPAAEGALAPGGGLWIVWPKKASGVASDLDGNYVRAFGMDRGYVDYKVCAVDDTWSGFLFARKQK